MSEVAKAAGNPRWSALAAILHATGMKLTVTRAG